MWVNVTVAGFRWGSFIDKVRDFSKSLKSEAFYFFLLNVFKHRGKEEGKRFEVKGRNRLAFDVKGRLGQNPQWTCGYLDMGWETEIRGKGVRIVDVNLCCTVEEL